MDNFERIKKYVLGSDDNLSFVALKTNAVDTVTAKIVMDILTQNGCKVIYHAPAIYTPENVSVHYKEIYDGYIADPNGKFKFYPNLVEYFTRGPIYGLVVSGPDAVKFVKGLCGATKDPANGTMRRELANAYGIEYNKEENGIHASGEIDEARREIGNFISAVYSNVDYTIPQAEQMADISDVIESYSSKNSVDATL